MPPPAANEAESIRKARDFLSARVSLSSNAEQIDTQTSESQVRAAHDLGAEPVVILSHSSTYRLDPTLPEPISLKLEAICQALQSDLRKISSNSTLRQSANGGHTLHAEDPQLVIRGIRQALQAAEQQVAASYPLSTD